MRPLGVPSSGVDIDAVTICSEITRRMDGLYQLDSDMRMSMEGALQHAVEQIPAHRVQNMAIDVLDLPDVTTEWSSYLKKLPVNKSIVWQPQQQALLGCRLKKVILDRDFGTGK